MWNLGTPYFPSPEGYKGKAPTFEVNYHLAVYNNKTPLFIWWKCCKENEKLFFNCTGLLLTSWLMQDGQASNYTINKMDVIVQFSILVPRHYSLVSWLTHKNLMKIKKGTLESQTDMKTYLELGQLSFFSGSLCLGAVSKSPWPQQRQ